MRFGILGPLLVCDADVVVAVPAARQRVLLAALLVNAGQAVPVDALADVVWDGSPPAGAAATLRTHVMRLRRVLGPGPGSRLLTRYPGYLVQVGEEEVDFMRFTCLCREGGAAVRAGAWAQASGTLEEALGLWRGTPLADIPSQTLQQREVPRLEQLRLQALEWLIDARLHLGRHGELVHELQSLTAEHPLRERFHAQFMLALYRCGRQAEALQAYQAAREVLVAELGADPGEELREVHQAVLRGELHKPAAPATREVPAQLPADVSAFTGRRNELAVLDTLLAGTGWPEPVEGALAAGETATAVVISAVSGTAGVGKTALAVHWAHQAAGEFPDGQLYVNLRGYDLGPPVAAADALAGFLRALGVPGQDIPAEEDERAARYRSLLAGRQMLIVLDNAGSAEQVRPLLPGSPGCVVIVTSRDALAGLVARDGAARLDLDLLPRDEAVSLLRALLGDRVHADPQAAAALAEQCARLPLALRVAAELAYARPAIPLAALVAELADQRRRLDLLDAGGDPATAVSAVFSWSYRHLDPAAARTFRLVGLHPGPDLDRYAAAALTATTADQAGQMLDVLARAHLTQPAEPVRHGLHDLLRAYAHHLATEHDTEDERRAALTRLFDYYLHAAADAMDTLVPAERHRRPRILPPATPAPPAGTPAAARAWLDTERNSLVAVTVHMTGNGWPGHATRLAATLFRYLDVGGHYPEAISIHTCARRAAQDTGDRAAEARALNNLGNVDWRQGRYQQATSHYQQALTLFREIGNHTGAAHALGNLGMVEDQQGRYQQAISHYQQALTLFREIGDRSGQANALNNLAFSDLRLGRYQQATSHLQHALALFRETGDRLGEAAALDSLGIADLRQGRYQQATSHLQHALTLFREIGDRTGEANALNHLGIADLRQGHYQQATSHLQHALTLFREIGDRSGEAEALNGLGEVLLATGQPGHARTQHATALGLAAQIGNKDEQARAHNGLGQAHHVIGDPGQARHHWQEALTLYTSLGAPEADQVKAQLATADIQGQ
jgi:DNA-binding SARP family transcriptional activator/Flp pilus assembly protein TadD